MGNRPYNNNSITGVIETVNLLQTGYGTKFLQPVVSSMNCTKTYSNCLTIQTANITIKLTVNGAHNCILRANTQDTRIITMANNTQISDSKQTLTHKLKVAQEGFQFSNSEIISLAKLSKMNFHSLILFLLWLAVIVILSLRLKVICFLLRISTEEFKLRTPCGHLRTAAVGSASNPRY
jgi:hypothetical protein